MNQMKRTLVLLAATALLFMLCGMAQAANYYSETNDVNSAYTFDRIDWSHTYDDSVDSPYTAKLTVTAFDVDLGEVDKVYLKNDSGADIYLGDLVQLGTWDSYHDNPYNYYTTTEFDISSYLAPNMDFYVMIYNGLANHAMSITTSVLEVTATPIPGAVWLLGSGLVGLVGIRRKMKA